MASAYGADYRRARARLLASNPPCWRCGAPATTADHYPPVSEVGPHLNLRPACAHCNFSDGGKIPRRRQARKDWKRRWV